MVKGKLVILAAIMLFFTGIAWAQLIPDPDVQGKIGDGAPADYFKG